MRYLPWSMVPPAIGKGVPQRLAVAFAGRIGDAAGRVGAEADGAAVGLGGRGRALNQVTAVLASHGTRQQLLAASRAQGLLRRRSRHRRRLGGWAGTAFCLSPWRRRHGRSRGFGAGGRADCRGFTPRRRVGTVKMVLQAGQRNCLPPASSPTCILVLQLVFVHSMIGIGASAHSVQFPIVSSFAPRKNVLSRSERRQSVQLLNTYPVLFCRSPKRS